jgi:hypothetical protein
VLALRGGDQRAVRRAGLFFFELSGRAKRLLRDVHQLARAYGWSEAAIVSLPLDRRLAYLLLVEEDSDAALLADVRGGP